jgi:hypothetical protein
LPFRHESLVLIIQHSHINLVIGCQPTQYLAYRKSEIPFSK